LRESVMSALESYKETNGKDFDWTGKDSIKFEQIAQENQE